MMNLPESLMGLTPYQLEMYYQVCIHQHEKYGSYKHHLLERWFPITRLTCPAVIGTFSITSQQTKQRWMIEKNSLEMEGARFTPADLARAYLLCKYPDRKQRRITTVQYRNFYDQRRSAPIYAEPCTIDDACYVDIKSAYWSIVSAVGWDVDYMPGRWLKVKSDAKDFPFASNKMARNCLVSLGANPTGSMKIWTGKELTVKRAGNAFVNLMLWTLVMDVLNAIAEDCLKAGAKYCFTDGFISKATIAPELQSIIASWGFASTIKHRGAATVSAAGAYSIGDVKTKQFIFRRPHAADKVDRTVRRDWLRERINHFSWWNKVQSLY